MEVFMPQSLSLVIIHLIFSTKGRFPCLPRSIRSRLHAYLAVVARNKGCEAYRAGGTADHVHIVLRLARTVAVAELVEKLKTSSSMWLKKHRFELGQFAWQHRYGAFSVAPGELKAIMAYIENQEEHHRIKTFQEEYLELLKETGVEYDERYLWD
jgi:putative transposase